MKTASEMLQAKKSVICKTILSPQNSILEKNMLVYAIYLLLYLFFPKNNREAYIFLYQCSLTSLAFSYSVVFTSTGHQPKTIYHGKIVYLVFQKNAIWSETRKITSGFLGL
jgi:hypothetical protein